VRYDGIFAIVNFEVDFLKTCFLVSPDAWQKKTPSFYCTSLNLHQQWLTFCANTVANKIPCGVLMINLLRLLRKKKNNRSKLLLSLCSSVPAFQFAITRTLASLAPDDHCVSVLFQEHAGFAPKSVVIIRANEPTSQLRWAGFVALLLWESWILAFSCTSPATR